MKALRFLVAAAVLLGCAFAATADPQRPFDPRGRPTPNDPFRFPVEITRLTAARCTGLSALSLEDTTITAAEVVSAGNYHPPGTPRTFPSLIGLPKFCRVAGTVRPTEDSTIKFEVWIPYDGSYRDRYLQVGNGGFSGAIVFDALGEGLRRGYATASTDDGNQTPNDAGFVAGHPERVIDYGYRALKRTTDNAKAIITALMGAPAKSYFHGCSNGGREALMEALRYPTDFDGIVAGAPANAFTHQFTSFAWNTKQIYPPVALEPLIPASRLSILSTAVRAQCAGHDGGLSSDKFLTNPLACHVDFGPITCPPGSRATSCLTPREVGIIRQIYAGPVYDRTHTQIFPGLEPGAEAHPANWPFWVTGLPRPDGTGTNLSMQAYFGSQFFGYFMHGFWPFDIRTINYSSDVNAVDAAYAETLNSDDPDLLAFYDHGGKLLQYHGFDDAAVAPKNSINYWASVRARLRELRPSLSATNLDNFHRLFMVPGMGHCAGGDGANEFGNGPRGAAMDPAHDLMLAMEAWVEHGTAPAKIIARHRSPTFERPLCPYPKLPRFVGPVGLEHVASSWTCAAPLTVFSPEISRKFFPKKMPIPPEDPLFRTH